MAEDGQALLQVDADHSESSSCRWVLWPSLLTAAFGAVMYFGFHPAGDVAALRGLAHFEVEHVDEVNPGDSGDFESRASFGPLAEQKDELVKLLRYLRSHKPVLKQHRAGGSGSNISDSWQ